MSNLEEVKSEARTVEVVQKEYDAKCQELGNSEFQAEVLKATAGRLKNELLTLAKEFNTLSVPAAK